MNCFPATSGARRRSRGRLSRKPLGFGRTVFMCSKIGTKMVRKLVLAAGQVPGLDDASTFDSTIMLL